MRERGGRAVLAPILFAVPLAEVLIAIAAGIASDRGWSFLLNHFVVTNAVIGGSLTIAGWPIAWQRPRNPIGWLLLAGGVFMRARLPRSHCWPGGRTPEMRGPFGEWSLPGRICRGPGRSPAASR